MVYYPPAKIMLPILLKTLNDWATRRSHTGMDSPEMAAMTMPAIISIHLFLVEYWNRANSPTLFF